MNTMNKNALAGVRLYRVPFYYKIKNTRCHHTGAEKPNLSLEANIN
jgi:hypothetical protein